MGGGTCIEYPFVSRVQGRDYVEVAAESRRVTRSIIVNASPSLVHPPFLCLTETVREDG